MRINQFDGGNKIFENNASGEKCHREAGCELETQCVQEDAESACAPLENAHNGHQTPCAPLENAHNGHQTPCALSMLGSVLNGLETGASAMKKQIQTAMMAIKAGTYQVNALHVSRRIINEALVTPN